MLELKLDMPFSKSTAHSNLSDSREDTVISHWRPSPAQFSPPRSDLDKHLAVASILPSVGFRRRSARETVQPSRAPAPEASARAEWTERARPPLSSREVRPCLPPTKTLGLLAHFVYNWRQNGDKMETNSALQHLSQQPPYLVNRHPLTPNVLLLVLLILERLGHHVYIFGVTENRGFQPAERRPRRRW